MSNKKTLVFVASSTTMLLELEARLSKVVNIIWVVYQKNVYKQLLASNVPSSRIYQTKIGLPFFLRPKINRLMPSVLRRQLSRYFRPPTNRYFVNLAVKRINRIHKPAMWIADSTGILANIDIASPKGAVPHSVTYKRYILLPKLQMYDVLFLPGFYHKKRITRTYWHDASQGGQLARLIVVGNLKVGKFVDAKTLSNRKYEELLKTMNLHSDWPIVLFAPTSDAFSHGRFFPMEFGDQIAMLEEYAEFLANNRHNLVIKLHHKMYFQYEESLIRFSAERKNVFVVRSEKNITDADDILRACDIIVTDTSGVATTGIYLDKKIIFLEPDEPFNWEDADIESNLRAGYVCETYDDLVNSSLLYFQFDKFKLERKRFIELICFEKDKNAYDNLSKEIRVFVGA